MEERLRFVARLLEEEAMSDLAREFGISRKPGYKEHGLEALCDRSRRPWRYANRLPVQVETLIVRIKREKPHWGARKVRELLVKRQPAGSGELVVAGAEALKQHLAASRNQQRVQAGHTAIALHLRKAGREVAIGGHGPMSA